MNIFFSNGTTTETAGSIQLSGAVTTNIYCLIICDSHTSAKSKMDFEKKITTQPLTNFTSGQAIIVNGINIHETDMNCVDSLRGAALDDNTLNYYNLRQY